MDDTYARALNQGYGLKIHSAARNRGGFICKTDKGLFEIKRNNETEMNIRFENDVKNHLYQSGFPYVRRFEPALDGNPYYVVDGGYFVVEKYTPCEVAEMTSFDILYSAVRILARLHNQAEGVKSDYGVFCAGRLPEIFQKRQNELSRIRKRISVKGSRSKIDFIVMKNYDYCKDKIQQAQSLLKECSYESLMKSVEQKKMICHNAYKGENILQTTDKHFFITGFQKCSYDYSILDLAEFIRRHFKNPESSAKSVYNILLEYDSIRPLSSQDRKMICAILTYPYKFLKICNEYYNKRRVYVSDAMVVKLEGCIEQSGRTQKVINEFLRG